MTKPSVGTRLLSAVLLGLLCLGPGFAHGAHRRVYMLGNSLTDDVLYNGFANIVAAAGNTVALGRNTIPGAPIVWLWEHPNDGFMQDPYGHYKTAFSNFVWDAVTLQPFSTYAAELEHARYFAQALRGEGTFGPADAAPPGPGVPTGISPDGTVHIYAQWPNGMLAGWNSATWLGTNAANRDTALYYETMVRELRTREPATEFRLIPVGHVFNELHQLTRAGRLPGVTHHSDFMLDAIHLNDRGSYIAGLTFYAVIYGNDPRGQAVVAPYQVTAAQAAIIQQAVWKVVAHHPLCGLTNSLTVTTLSLPDALENAAYSTTLAAALNDGAVTWSVSAGALPGGLELSPAGVLSGSPAAPGVYDFTVRASDATHVGTRDFILYVSPDEPPRVTTAVLPAAAAGTPYAVTLDHEGGFGAVTWTLSAGDLPHGLTLSPEGVIAGTPTSIEGTFIATLAATDTIPATDLRAMALIVGPPEDGTLIVAPVEPAPTIDGSLAESCWTLPFTAAVARVGTPDNHVRFGVRWNSDALFMGVHVTDGDVVAAGDAVHLFIDGRHDREGAFNSDDRHLVIHPDGAWTELNGRPAGISLAVASVASGYAIEVRVPFANLERVPDGHSLSVGFDLAVEDVDTAGGPAAVQHWRSIDPAAPSPAVMGNLLLAAGPVATNRLVNGDFTNTSLLRPAYPAQATTAMAGAGWVANGVSSRPFSSVDSTGYGYPRNAISVYGDSAGVCLYQVIHDARATTGRGFLRFDVKYAAAAVAYRLFAYNGAAAAVDARIGVKSQQHPAVGGSPDATLLSGTLAAVPSSGTWREVAIPVDFGPGYDYLILAFSSPGSGVNVDSRIDNVELGPAAAERITRNGRVLRAGLGDLLRTDLTGTDPALHLPWTNCATLAGGLSYGGISAAPGIVVAAGNNAIFYSRTSGSTPSTLAEVLASRHYLGFNLSAAAGDLDLEGGVFQFKLNRLGNGQTPSRFAVFSSVAGYAEADALYVSHAVSTEGVQTLAFTLPSGAAYRDLTSIGFRIYAFNGQYAGKVLSFNEVAVGGTVIPPARTLLMVH